MKRMKDIEIKVADILYKYPESRANDFVLYALYIKENNAELSRVGLIYALMEAKKLNMPNFESITRARRKIQQRNPELKPPHKTEKIRASRELDFRKYAREK